MNQNSPKSRRCIPPDVLENVLVEWQKVEEQKEEEFVARYETPTYLRRQSSVTLCDNSKKVKKPQ